MAKARTTVNRKDPYDDAWSRASRTADPAEIQAAAETKRAQGEAAARAALAQPSVVDALKDGIAKAEEEMKADATGRLFPASAYRNATGAERHPEDPWSWGPVEFPGQLCSKSNSRKIVNFGKRLAVIKSAESRRYVADFIKAHKTAQPFTGPVRLEVQAIYKDRRRDLDVALLQDALQAAGVIKNDRQIVEIHAWRYVDKDNPRTWILLTEAKPDDH